MQLSDGSWNDLGPPLDLAGPLFGQLWRSLRLCLVARLCWKVSSKYDSVQKLILQGRTGQQKHKIPKFSNLVCNILVFFKIDSHNVLTFAILLYFAITFLKNRRMLLTNLMKDLGIHRRLVSKSCFLQSIYLAAAAG